MTACAACRALTAWIAARSEPVPESFKFVTATVMAGSAPSFEPAASKAEFPAVLEGIAFSGPLEAQPDHNGALAKLIKVKTPPNTRRRRNSRPFKTLSSCRVDQLRPPSTD
jgi:hypothetical protein